MNVKHYHYQNNQWLATENATAQSEAGLQWFDFTYEEKDWPETIHSLTGLVIHENHIKDSLNVLHPPKCETASDYEYLIMSVIDNTQTQPLNLMACSFIFTDSLLISIHPKTTTIESSAFERLSNQKPSNRTRAVTSIAGLLHLLLNITINSQMEARIQFNNLMEQWQEKLMTRKVKTDGWADYYQLQRELNLLTNNTELQTDVLSTWEKETELELTEHQQIRFRDLSEHLDRVSRHLKDLREDSDNLLQIYFSITQEKTNRIVQLLTVISVIFLPLHLIAGLFGMNFTEMPMQNLKNGFWYILIGMVAIATLFYVLLLIKSRSR